MSHKRKRPSEGEDPALRGTVDSLIDQTLKLEDENAELMRENTRLNKQIEGLLQESGKGVLKELGLKIRGELEAILGEIRKRERMLGDREQFVLGRERELLHAGGRGAGLPKPEPRGAPLRSGTGEASDISGLIGEIKKGLAECKDLLSKGELETNAIATEARALGQELKEKTKRVEMYALLNKKLSLIKDQYIELKNRTNL